MDAASRPERGRRDKAAAAETGSDYRRAENAGVRSPRRRLLCARRRTTHDEGPRSAADLTNRTASELNQISFRRQSTRAAIC